MKKTNPLVSVLLVGNPKTVKGFDRLGKMPSLNLSSLAANMDRTLCDVKIADLVLKNTNPQKHLLKILKTYRPDIVGFTAMAFQYQTALNLATLVKIYNRSITVVMGGYHVTSDKENILHSKDMQCIDYIISGEGEIAFNEFINAFASDKDFSKVPGISYLKDKQPVHNLPPPLVNVEDLKIPDREARIYRKGYSAIGLPVDVIETSRGCVFDCNFCSIRQMYGKSFRKFSIDRIIADMKDAKKHGAKLLFISDDNITIDGKRFKELCARMMEEKLNLRFAIQASVKGLRNTPRLIETIAEAGCMCVFLGIENVSDEALKFMQKGGLYERDDTAWVIRELKKNGIFVIGGFIFGNPEDTEKTIKNNFDFAIKSGLDLQLFNILTPHIKTGIREELFQKGLITNLSDYSKYNHYEANVRTNYLTSEELFYIRNKYDARFPLESGGIWRLFRQFPLFFSKLMFKMIFTEFTNWKSFILKRARI